MVEFWEEELREPVAQQAQGQKVGKEPVCRETWQTNNLSEKSKIGVQQIQSNTIAIGSQVLGPMYDEFGLSASAFAVLLQFLYFTSPTTGGPLTMTISVHFEGFV